MLKYLTACSLAFAIPANASTTMYTDKAAFQAAVGTMTKVLLSEDLFIRDWNGYGEEPFFIDTFKLGSTVTIGTTVLTAEPGKYLMAYHDAYEGPYAANGSSRTVFFSSPNNALGIDFGAFFLGGPLTLTANGATQSAVTPDFAMSTTFIGIISDGPISGSVQGTYELDFARFYEAKVPVVLPPSAVPEPKTWVMLTIAFFSIGSALRKRRTQKLIAI